MTHPLDCKPEACQMVADAAVKKVFAMLGVDTDKPESIEDFREDLRFGKKMRRAADYGFTKMVGLMLIGMCIAVYYAVISRVK